MIVVKRIVDVGNVMVTKLCVHDVAGFNQSFKAEKTIIPTKTFIKTQTSAFLTRHEGAGVNEGGYIALDAQQLPKGRYALYVETEKGTYGGEFSIE